MRHQGLDLGQATVGLLGPAGHQLRARSGRRPPCSTRKRALARRTGLPRVIHRGSHTQAYPKVVPMSETVGRLLGGDWG